MGCADRHLIRFASLPALLDELDRDLLPVRVAMATFQATMREGTAAWYTSAVSRLVGWAETSRRNDVAVER